MSAKHHKKAMLISRLVTVIVLFLAGAVLLAVFIRLLNPTEDVFDRETCRLSVLGMAYDPSGIVNFKCSTNQLEIGRKFFVKNGKKSAIFEVNRVLADEMSDCWYQFLEGGIDPFGAFGSSVLSFNSKNRCFICAEITFKDTQVSGLKKYLESTKHSEGRTYAQFLYKQNNAILAPNSIDTNKKYSVVWISLLKGILDDEIKKAGHVKIFDQTVTENTYSSMITLAWEFATEGRYSFVTLVPSESVVAYCDQIM